MKPRHNETQNNYKQPTRLTKETSKSN